MTLQIEQGRTLEQAKQWLRERVEGGERCPCCTQMAKVYKRTITSTMARWLLEIYRKAPDKSWMHMARDIGVTVYSGDASKLVYWELLEEKQKDETNTDTRTSGYWRITDKGIAFACGLITVPKHVRIYDSRSLGFVAGDKEIDIKQALGKKFSYLELMSQ